MQRINGFINLNKVLKEIGVLDASFDNLKNESKIKYLEKLYNTSIHLKFVYNHETYFYKSKKNNIPYNELVAYELACDFGLPALEYDLAILNGRKGVISKNYKKDNVKYIPGARILKDYYTNNIYNISDFNNLEAIWDALEYRYQNNPHKDTIIKKLMEKIVNIFIFDILISNDDRHEYNWEIVESANFIDINILYDNERILNDEKIVSLTIMEEESEYLIDSLKNFFNVSSEEFRNIINSKLWIISEENLLKVFKRIEEKIECEIPKKYKEKYLNFYKKNLYELNEILENNIKCK